MKEKILRMLKMYRDKLELAEMKPHINHAEALRCQGAISVLETLYEEVLHQPLDNGGRIE